MFNGLGVGGGGSLIGGLACLLAPIPFIFYRFGAAIRRKSKFAPTDGGPPAAAIKEQTNKDEVATNARRSTVDSLSPSESNSTATSQRTTHRPIVPDTMEEKEIEEKENRTALETAF